MGVTGQTYKKTTAWFSCLAPNLVHALAASSSAAPMALPSLAPLGPFVEPVYVLIEMMALEDSCAVGSSTWNLLARCAARAWSFCMWTGRAGSEACVCWGAPPVAMLAGLLPEDNDCVYQGSYQDCEMGVVAVKIMGRIG